MKNVSTNPETPTVLESCATVTYRHERVASLDPNLRHSAWVEVDLGNVVANARAVLAQAPTAKLLAVVKANAYGLGAVRVAKALECVHPWGFAVATPNEGIELRDNGVERPIVVLRPPDPSMREVYHKYELRPVVEQESAIGNWTVPFHLEIDTGMSRTGVRWNDETALKAIARRKPECAFTHFHSADRSEESVRLQCDRFRKALHAMNYIPPLLHVANSAGIWRHADIHSIVRPGIVLYGGCPGQGIPIPLPVVSLRARVASVRYISQGESVSYGAEWSAERDTWVATLTIGYADGVPRGLFDSAVVLFHGRRVPLAGRVTMDMMMIDVGPQKHNIPEPGDIVTLIGADRDERITLDEFATWANTISYEVLTRLGARLPRIYS